MGVGRTALARDADELEQLAGPGAGGRLRFAEPLLDRFRDLVHDATDGIQRVHRPLEHDRDLAPAVAPELVLGLLDEVDPHEVDLAPGDPAVARQDAHDRQGRRRLAAARLADDPERLAVVEPEADAVDRPDRAALEAEPRLEVAHLEERRAGTRLLRRRPLAPSPDRHGGGNGRRTTGCFRVGAALARLAGRHRQVVGTGRIGDRGVAGGGEITRVDAHRSVSGVTGGRRRAGSGRRRARCRRA